MNYKIIQILLMFQLIDQGLPGTTRDYQGLTNRDYKELPGTN